jgi:hypothetical protein
MAASNSSSLTAVPSTRVEAQQRIADTKIVYVVFFFFVIGLLSTIKALYSFDMWLKKSISSFN